MKITELQKGVSVIICSFNGADKLPTTLQHLINQRTNNNINWEVIFIDNNSNDGSLKVVEEYWKDQDSKVPIRLLNESTPGKYYALTRGINKAKYTYFIVCDDDNWLSEDYIERAYRSLEENPCIGALGGRSIAVLENRDSEIPLWLTKDQERYALGVQGEKSGNITYRKFIWGAGMVSHVTLYRNFYALYPSLFIKDAQNKSHFIAEDTEYCLRLILRGYHLFYDKDLILQHFVPNDRLTEDYNIKLNKRIEESFDIIDKYIQSAKIFGSVSYSKVNRLRLKILTPIRLFLAKNKKSKIKHNTLFQLLFNSPTDIELKKILNFISDNRLPRIRK